MVCLIRDFEADEALTGLRTFCEYVKLFGYLFTLGTIFLGFISYARHKVGGHCRDSYWCEDTAEWRDELCFDYFVGDVINEAFQSNL